MMKKIVPPIDTEPMSWVRQMERERDWPDLPLLDRPCRDCAVECGLYKDLSDDLSRQPLEIGEAISKKWVCHNHTYRACRGNWNNVMERTSERKDYALKALVGSRLYNLHTEDSDFDYRYVQISPLHWALSPFRNLDTKATVDGHQDDTVWEMRVFCKYAANGNPSVFEALYSDETSLHPELSPRVAALVEELLANRSRFLDARRVLDAHRGYATAQLKKIKWDDPDLPHTRKAIVAYLRILDQGIRLLRDGDFHPRYPQDSSYRAMLMEIKEGYQPSMESAIRQDMERLESESEKAFEGTKLAKADHAWIEMFIARIYTQEWKHEHLVRQ